MTGEWALDQFDRSKSSQIRLVQSLMPKAARQVIETGVSHPSNPLASTQLCKPFACNNGFLILIAGSPLDSVELMTCVDAKGFDQ